MKQLIFAISGAFKEDIKASVEFGNASRAELPAPCDNSIICPIIDKHITSSQTDPRHKKLDHLAKESERSGNLPPANPMWEAGS